MPDKEKDERILFLLRVWMLLNTTHWPAVKTWVEARLNEELPDNGQFDLEHEALPT
jgi:hypothetical protein